MRFWFKRKPANRRLGRGHVLDVKLRSSQVRAARARAAALGFGAVFAVIFGVYVAWRTGDWALNRLVYENKAFAIEEVDIQTDGVLSKNLLWRWGGVKLGQNLLALDLARVKRDLKLVPLIQLAAVERVLPHTLRIQIIEREPIAQVNVPRLRPGGGVDLKCYHLDSDGWVMQPLVDNSGGITATQPPEPLPIVSGISYNEIQPGRRIEAPQVQAALRLILAFEHTPLASALELRRIDVSTPETLVVTTGQGAEVTFGMSDLELQLRRWREVYEEGLRLNKAIAALDLAVSNNIPARLLDASAVPPITPKTPKTFRNKKKHV